MFHGEFINRLSFDLVREDAFNDGFEESFSDINTVNLHEGIVINYS